MHNTSTDRRHWILMLGGLVLLGVLFLQLGPRPIIALFETMGANLIVIVGIFVCHEIVRAMALGRCLPAGTSLSLWQLTWVQCLGEAVRALTHTGPLVSEPARGWMLARQGVDGAHAYAAAVSELIVNSCISALVTIVVLGAALVSIELGRKLAVLSHVLVWISLGWVLVVAVGLAGRIYIIGAILNRVGTLPFIGRRLGTDPTQVRRMEDAILNVLRDRPTILVQVVLLEFVAQALLIFDTYWVFRSMDLPVSVGRTLLVEALTKLANFIQLVGATEGAYVVVFEWLGMTAAVGFALSLVKRVRSLVIAGFSLLVMAWIDRSMWAVATARHSPPS
jgi:lysylphosphatidylglycerol synthase-like protein